MPVTLVLIHVDGFLRLVGLDKFFLSLLEPVIIFKVQGVLEMHIWQFIACMVFCKLECIIEFLLVGFKVDGGLDQTVFDEELSATISAHTFSDLDGNLSKLFLCSISLGHTKCFFPEVMSSIHIDSIGPRASLNIVMLCLLEVTFHLKGLSQVMVGILQQVGSELHDKTDHVVKHLCLLVHVDSKVRLSSRQVHLFGLLVVALSLKLLCFLHLDCAVLALRQVVNDKLVGFLPLVRSNVHLECLDILSSFHEEGLSLLVLANLSVVACDLDLVLPDLVSRLVLHKVDSAVPVASGQCRLNCLVKDTSLNEVIHSLVELSLRDKPVTPLFLQSHNVVRERLLSEIYGLFEGMTHYERVKSSVEKAHLLEEISSLLVHV